ncbi:discoidin domain-containing protein [Mucilaginibacter sp. SMC90]|uniref:discoidin domain-containing protein n=1 Tax=Mucilaginibacter sp. SMC90 TaxID=2929803 RepID=UPI001FB3128D|nr:discoidin domain-containing protein [Mucilaginibacter sp. SMC90]UOE47784.1 discoidin domain-containing protein [Mucilaginibacter sp. SMC90]
MKKIGILFIVISICSGILIGCKKYKYNFPDGYDTPTSSGSVDTTDLGTDRSLYAQARIFPGLVTDSQPRIADTSIVFNFNYTYVPATTLGVSYVPLPIFSTGLFAPAGELVEIDVPSGLFGLSVQVGSQADNVTGQIPYRRDPIVSTVKALFPGKNTVRNLYGGYIWIKPSFAGSAPETLHFRHAVATSDFILGITTDLAAWQRRVLASGVPWLELRSQHTAFSISRDYVVRGIQNGTLSNIDKTMAEWDKVFVEDYYKFSGLIPGNQNLQYRAPELPERFVMDIQTKGGVYIHNGQPIVAQSADYWFDEWTNLNTLITGNSSGTYKQISLNYQSSAASFWWGGAQPSVLYFNVMKTALRNNQPIPTLSGLGTAASLPTIVPVALTYVNSGAGKYIDKDAIANVATNSATFKLVPFLQLFAKVRNPVTNEDGFGLVPYLAQKAQAISLSGLSDMSKINFFFTGLCDYGQMDYSKFFDAWGIPVSTITRSAVAKKYKPMTDPIWLYNPLSRQYVTDHYPLRQTRVYNDRVNWLYTASDFAANEGALNITSAMGDGDPNTYWHGCYSGCSPLPSPVPPPHIINIDMAQTTRISGFYVVQRYGNRRTTDVTVEYSTDNVSWTSLGNFPLANQDGAQEFILPQKINLRYMRVTIAHNSYDGAPYSALAEIGTFYDGN